MARICDIYDIINAVAPFPLPWILTTWACWLGMAIRW